MENIQIVKCCPWISDEINIREYFEEYNKVLDEANGCLPHNEKFDKKERLREFFHITDEVDVQFSRRSTPAHFMGTRSTGVEFDDDDEEGNACLLSDQALSSKLVQNENENNSKPFRSKSAEGSFSVEKSENNFDDPFDIDQMEKGCSIDLLTVEEELPPRELCESGRIGDTGRITNWYAGAFMDGVIPDGGPEKLMTLANQVKELYKRETVRDYTRLRHRLLKYASTVRMVVKKENSPEEVLLEENTPRTCLREVVFNVRIQRPYHKRTYHKKGSNKYPKHSQELLMLGSQKLTELKDAIVCINDFYVHKDMSNNPDTKLLSTLPTLKTLYPSSLFYINGVFMVDTRPPAAKDYSEALKKWAAKYPNIGPMTTKIMSEVYLKDLKIRLGYPYVYQHLGNCEHLITFTDARLHHRTDIQDPSRYPLSRGNPIKLSVTCCACNLFPANWIVKDDPRLPTPYAHFCQECLKLFCYDFHGVKLENFKLYPFLDEFTAQVEKEKQNEVQPRKIEVKLNRSDGTTSHLIIEPFKEDAATF